MSDNKHEMAIDYLKDVAAMYDEEVEPFDVPEELDIEAGANAYEVNQENSLDTVRSEEESVCPEGTPKLDADFAGYMELEGAVKDGDCKIVHVEGGISKDLGCCNLYHRKPGAKLFNCGNCKYED